MPISRYIVVAVVKCSRASSCLPVCRAAGLLLVNAMLGQFITGFAGRSFVVALPTITYTLHADMPGISWAILA